MRYWASFICVPLLWDTTVSTKTGLVTGEVRIRSVLDFKFYHFVLCNSALVNNSRIIALVVSRPQACTVRCVVPTGRPLPNPTAADAASARGLVPRFSI